MSSTVVSRGLIAVVVNTDERLNLYNHSKRDDALRDEMSDRLWESRSGLHLNYEGTLVYFDELSHATWEERENYYGLQIQCELGQVEIDEFIGLCNDYGISVDPSTIKPYQCIWYNGSDNPMDTMKIGKFRERAGL
ncbi:hypothetical protein C121_33 [Stenotrophomonas phage C121]|uniref:hypothetical protein n=1 Tax=Stenotrophomonas phage C121 TaxID=2914029 RepID=UPI0023290D16|nr:hypothetical protein PP752_gp33 [Stenotrophomonas phage C121]UKL14766.1 hypothetical protein C121_33 [Stenotrophomonas phage C121]